MFQRGSKSVSAQVATAVTEGLKNSYGGNAVVIVKDGLVLAVKLDPTPQPTYTYGVDQVRNYGPADTLANTLDDVIRHVTGTPKPEVEEDTDEVRYRPVEDDAPSTPSIRSHGADLAAQADVLAAIRDQVSIWTADTGSQGVVSHAGLEAYLDGLERKCSAGVYVQRPPF